jgi:CubicO group peptidase (beta-lactamase class C family)
MLSVTHRTRPASGQWNVVSMLAPVVALIAATPAVARPQVVQPSQIDAIFSQYASADSPGCLVGVVKDGRLVYQQGYGMANLDYGLPHSPRMVYYVGSVSKQFTAAAIALLAAEGRIALDDDVRRYIPELPDYGRTITIRHLVHHTGGVRDIYTLMSLAGIRMEDVFPDNDMLALIARQRELNFMPGDDYLYSNSGYWLLGRIIERVTGRTLAEYAHEKIFRPLGMNDTFFHDQPSRIIPNRVISYGGSAASGFRISYIFNFDKIGAGGLYTTLGDLVKWDANFYEPAIGGSSFVETMLTRGILTSGDTLPYAFGINVQDRRGLRMVRHSGSLMGFRADLVRYPTERFSVITLCNLGTIDPAALADRVTELFIGDRFRPATTAARPASQVTDGAVQTAPWSPDPARLPDYAARYYSEELDAVYVIAVRQNGLTLSRPTSGTQIMRPVGADTFAVGSQVFTFERAADGAISAFTVEAGRVRNIVFVRQP